MFFFPGRSSSIKSHHSHRGNPWLSEALIPRLSDLDLQEFCTVTWRLTVWKFGMDFSRHLRVQNGDRLQADLEGNPRNSNWKVKPAQNPTYWLIWTLTHRIFCSICAIFFDLKVYKWEKIEKMVSITVTLVFFESICGWAKLLVFVHRGRGQEMK